MEALGNTTNDREDERRRKSVNTEDGQKKYRSLNKQLQRETDSAREKWGTDQCVALEELERQGRSDFLYRKVSQITKGRRKKRNIRINDNIGML